jgi:predicted RND superfamily exporter protein
VIVFSISLGLAVNDTIHFMVRFEEEWKTLRATDLDSAYREAIARTFHGTGQAIFVSSVLLAVGYSVLLVSQFPITQKFGLGMLVTVTGALLGDLFLLPACLMIFKPLRRLSARPLD